jgi:hypothetical protein
MEKRSGRAQDDSERRPNGLGGRGKIVPSVKKRSPLTPLLLNCNENGIEHMKKYKLWHRAQFYISYGIELMSYIFLWHTGNFLDFQRDDATTGFDSSDPFIFAS